VVSSNESEIDRLKMPLKKQSEKEDLFRKELLEHLGGASDRFGGWNGPKVVLTKRRHFWAVRASVCASAKT
jgi:hypothetical protein